MDIRELAREFNMHPGDVEAALDGATMVLRASREKIRPADKRALRGAAEALRKAIDRLSEDAVRKRLVAAVFREPDGPDEDGLARYRAWWAARARVDRALEGAQDLLALVRAGEEFKMPPGRPPYEHWTVAIDSLLEFWAKDLWRDVTISGHASDPRGVAASPAVRFVYRCMRLLGEDITEQACRTILQNLRNKKNESPPR